MLPSEDPEAWCAFHDEVLNDFKPEGPVQVGLASRIAEIMWRLRRIARAEQQSVSVAQTRRDVLAVDRSHAQPASGPADRPLATSGNGPDPDAIAGRRQDGARALGFYADVLIADMSASRHLESLPVLLPDDRTLEMLVRYEAHLSRDLKHTLHELEALQERRRGNPTPLARIDIS